MWFALEPVSPDWGADAPSFDLDGVIELSPDELFDELVQPDCWPEFFVDMLSVAWVTEPPHGVGSQRLVRLTTQTVHEHFTVFEPGKRWTFYVSRSTLPLVKRFMEDYRFEEAPGGTRLVWRVFYTPRWWLRPLHPILRPIFLKQFQDSFANLQQWARDRNAAR